MKPNKSSSNTPDRRTILQAIGSLTATGALIGKTSATSSSSNEQIDYQELDSESQAMFKRLVSGQNLQREGSELPTGLLRYDKVQYKQSTYRIQREYSRKAVYHLSFNETSKEEVAKRIDNLIGTKADSAGQYIESQGKIGGSDLSLTAQDALSTVGNRTLVEELPPEFINNDYLETNGSLYRILAGHSDVPVVSFSAVKA